MQSLVLYSKWRRPWPATLYTLLLSAIGGSAVVSHYKNYLIVFLIIPSCSKHPVYSVSVCVCVYTSCQMESLFASNLLSLVLHSGVCLLPPYKKHLTPTSPSPLLPLSSSSLFLFTFSLTHYPTAWSNQSAICEWKLPPHTIISSPLVALNFALNLWLFLFFHTVQLINRAAQSRHSAICESIS